MGHRFQVIATPSQPLHSHLPQTRQVTDVTQLFPGKCYIAQEAPSNKEKTTALKSLSRSHCITVT